MYTQVLVNIVAKSECTLWAVRKSRYLTHKHHRQNPPSSLTVALPKSVLGVN